VPLAYPAYPQVIPKYEADKTTQIANALRNYAAVSTAQMKQVGENLNAIRMEQQTAGKKKVAFPVEPYSGKKKVDFAVEIASDIEEAKMTEDEVSAASDASTGYSAAEAIAAKMRKQLKRLGKQPTSAFDPIIDTTDTDYESDDRPAFPPGGGGGLPPRGRGRPQGAKSNMRSKQNIIADLKAQNIPFKTSMNAKQIQEIAELNGIVIEKL